MIKDQNLENVEVCIINLSFKNYYEFYLSLELYNIAKADKHSSQLRLKQ